MDSSEISSTFINKIPQIISTRHFIFKSNWLNDEINLQILDSYESKEWECIISHSELKNSADELEIPYEQFFDECKKALTTNGGIEHFQYSIEGNEFILTKDDEFKMQYLQVKVKPNYGLQQIINISAVDLIESLRNELSAGKEESKKLNEKQQAMLKTLEQCIQEMNVIERNLLKRFAVLLNSKKDKIAELQDLLVEKNNKLEDAGISGTESVKRKAADALRSSFDDEDYLKPTQVMTQPVSLPKRKKFDSTGDDATRRTSWANDKVDIVSSPLDKETISTQNIVLGESPDIFDQIC